MSNLERFKMSADQTEMAQLISECAEYTEIIVVNGRNVLTGNYESLICSFEENADGGCSILPLGIAFCNGLDAFEAYEMPYSSMEEDELEEYTYGATESNVQTEVKRRWWNFW